MKRMINCDVLRIIAFCLVVSVHFLLYNGFYNSITSGTLMWMFNVLRCFFVICVPLFIILTGYLMNKKTFNKDYCLKIGKILLSYLLCSLICVFVLNLITKSELSLKTILTSIFNFNGAPYAWYVNMYIGLYFFIPFLNVLWNNLENNKKKWLIIVLFIFVVFPTFINQHINIFPNYWCGVAYPILYYYVGCYLKDFPIKISTIKNLIIIFFMLISFGTFNYFKCQNNVFEWGNYSEYFSFQAFFVSLFFANLILSIKINLKNEKICNLLSKLSSLTFSAYLLSAIFDNYMYLYVLPNYGSNFFEKMLFFIPFVFGIAALSLLAAYLVSLIEFLLKKIIFFSKLLLKNKLK